MTIGEVRVAQVVIIWRQPAVPTAPMGPRVVQCWDYAVMPRAPSIAVYPIS